MIPIAKPLIGSQEKRALIDVLKSGRLASGPKVEEFEKQVSNLCKSKYALAVSNGTVALEIAMKAAGIGAGDEVITTPFTFVATVNAILTQGAFPVFVDIDKATFNINPSEIEAKITPKTKAIVPVDLYGQPHDSDEVNSIAKSHNLRVIEDAAQAIGASYGEKMAGNLGDVGTFSFYATKNVMTGEGGMIITDDDKIAQSVRILRNQGQDPQRRYDYVSMGYNCRLTDLQAAIGVEQMKKLSKINRKRASNARFFDKSLKDLSWLSTPARAKGRTHVYHQYTLTLSDSVRRDDFVAHLSKNEVGYGVYYPKPLYDYSHLSKFKASCPNADLVSQKVVSIPVHPLLSKQELNKIVEVIRSFK